MKDLKTITQEFIDAFQYILDNGNGSYDNEHKIEVYDNDSNWIYSVNTSTGMVTYSGHKTASCGCCTESYQDEQHISEYSYQTQLNILIELSKTLKIKS